MQKLAEEVVAPTEFQIRESCRVFILRGALVFPHLAAAEVFALKITSRPTPPETCDGSNDVQQHVRARISI